MNVWYSGFSKDNTDNDYVFFLAFTIYFQQHYFYGETKEAMKNKNLWFVFL